MEKMSVVLLNYYTEWAEKVIDRGGNVTTFGVARGAFEQFVVIHFKQIHYDDDS